MKQQATKASRAQIEQHISRQRHGNPRDWHPAEFIVSGLLLIGAFVWLWMTK
jgi:hypothetical protein